MDLAQLAGPRHGPAHARIWARRARPSRPAASSALENAAEAAQLDGDPVIVSVYPFGSSVTPLTDDDRADFAAYAAVARAALPDVRDFDRRQRAEPQPLLAAAVRADG